MSGLCCTLQAMNESSAQSNGIGNAETMQDNSAKQQSGFMRQLSSSVDGSQSDMQSIPEQAAGLAAQTQQAQSVQHHEPPMTVPDQVDAWSQSDPVPDIATTSGSVESGAELVCQTYAIVRFCCVDH